MTDGYPVFEFIQTMFCLNIEMSEPKEVPLKVSFLVISELVHTTQCPSSAHKENIQISKIGNLTDT